MNDQPHEPVYRAALDSASAELRQLAETVSRLRARQEQINVAVESLKLLVSSPELTISQGRMAPVGKPVYTMGASSAPPAKKVERVQALA
jgi:hypothetical protein